ncbi:formate dehydrogenase subunit alpha [Alphaproteobacteria bacterium]|nr:formate dehydrogenase subunit alpha [Alphaproteobacteria bacterium]
MTESISFYINGKKVKAKNGETIWDVSKREGNTIPHLCHSGKIGYSPDGNCRVCVVEVKGEKTLAASCIRKPTNGMEVFTNNTKVEKSQSLVLELLLSDQPEEKQNKSQINHFWNTIKKTKIKKSRFIPKKRDTVPKIDKSHPAMTVALDSCIQCGLCVRACRDVQVNDVLGMSGRGHNSYPIFDLNNLMGESSCVGCGECVQACPTGALIESSLVEESNIQTIFPEKKIKSLCPFCGVGCQTLVSVKENAVIAVDGYDGPANENRLCVKGRFGYDYINNPTRLKEPLIRIDKKTKSWDLSINDKNIFKYFRKASWNEALSLASGKFVEIRDKNQKNSLAGFGSAKGSNEEAYIFQKLIRTGFETNNVDHCTRLCHASSVAALLQSVGSAAVTAPFTAVKDTECIILIGARPEQNHPVAASFLKQAVKNGSKLIIIDPRKQDLSRYATYHLQFNPGQDLALLNSLIFTIIKENLTNKEYINTYTEGFDLLEKEIEKFDPISMEELCGIEQDVIRDVARTYAKAKSSIIFWGMGISQHVHGTQNAFSLINLALITGHVGRPGTGLHPLRGQNNVQGASDAGLIPMFYPDYNLVKNSKNNLNMENFWKKSLDLNPGKTVVEIIEEISHNKIKGLYVQGENPAMSDPDQVHARKALAKLEHLVVQDIFMTETAWNADVILPASAHAEKVGTYTNTNRQVQMGRAVVDPPGEVKQDWWIIQEIAKRMGLDWSYDSPEEIFEEMKLIMPSLDNISWERLEKESYVTYPAKSETSLGEEIIFTDGFPTTNNLAKIVPVKLIGPNESINDDYPLILSTGRMLEHWHTGTMTRRAIILDKLEPDPIIFMNEVDCKKYNLNIDKKVKIETRRGEIYINIRLDEDLLPGMIFLPFCFRESAANILTNSELDPIGKIPELKFSAARAYQN